MVLTSLIKEKDLSSNAPCEPEGYESAWERTDDGIASPKIRRKECLQSQQDILFYENSTIFVRKETLIR